MGRAAPLRLDKLLWPVEADAKTEPIPAELGFLASVGVDPETLLRAGRIARHTGVGADEALLGEGFPSDHFYRLLARHLGLPFLDEPMRPDLAPGRSPQAGEAGIVPVAPNRHGVVFLLAPRGHGLREILKAAAQGRGPDRTVAIAPPKRIASIVRRHDEAAVVDQATHGLRDRDRAASASGGLSSFQIVASAILAALFGSGLICFPRSAWLAVDLAFSALFLAAVLLRLGAAASDILPDRRREAPLPDHELPVYTILVPLHREAAVVKSLVGALDAIDYPRAKLDIKLIVEADDPETREAIRELGLPDRYDLIVAPRGQPQTKPRALNIALLYARGELVVVYDAEDVPDPGQLRAAAARFRARPEATACLQAGLFVDHYEHNWLTAMYGLDYAALFGVIKPGLASLGLPLPLGGTSNHFRTAALRDCGAWDAWNVTEDIDLGFRLARQGYRVESLESTTFEEAPLTLRRWMGQRSRWLKGWMVTLVVHTREPLRLFRELGLVKASVVSVCLLGTVASCLFGPPFILAAAWAAAAGDWLSPTSPEDAAFSAASLFLLGTGLASVGLPWMLALRRMRRLDLAVLAATLPAYLLLVSAAAWRALFEAVLSPYRWNKTEHGLAVRRLDRWKSAPPQATGFQDPLPSPFPS